MHLYISNIILGEVIVSWRFFIPRWDDDVVFKNCAKDDDKMKVHLLLPVYVLQFVDSKSSSIFS